MKAQTFINIQQNTENPILRQLREEEMQVLKNLRLGEIDKTYWWQQKKYSKEKFQLMDPWRMVVTEGGPIQFYIDTECDTDVKNAKQIEESFTDLKNANSSQKSHQTSETTQYSLWKEI